MVKNGIKMPSFCLARFRPHVRVRSQTIQLQLKEKVTVESSNPDDQSKDDVNVDSSTKPNDHLEDNVNVDSSTKPDDQLKENISVDSSKPGDQATEDSGSSCNEKETKTESETKVDEEPVKIIGRKVMIVVDSSSEAKTALQWALTHSVQSHDILVLLYVKKSKSKKGIKLAKEKATKVPTFLCSMKNTCQLKDSNLRVEISIIEGKEKGTTILEEAKKQEVTMLVLGQKKHPITWRLLLTWAGRPVHGKGGGMVDYCVQNATCMAVAVRRKNKRVGGYLITTKCQKDFWLLA